VPEVAAPAGADGHGQGPGIWLRSERIQSSAWRHAAPACSRTAGPCSPAAG